jgi:hypothetical protein
MPKSSGYSLKVLRRGIFHLIDKTILIEKGCRLNSTDTKKISKFGLIIYPENETSQGTTEEVNQD